VWAGKGPMADTSEYSDETSGSIKKQGISLPAENQLASGEGFCSMELLSK
jgi:hypothetical protein